MLTGYKKGYTRTKHKHMSRTHPLGPAFSGRTQPAGIASGEVAVINTGAEKTDALLGGGLAQAALHEIYAGLPDDCCAASGFALLLTLRACLAKPVLWVREDRDEQRNGRLYPLGLIELGADPAAILLVTAPDTLSLLRAGADIVNCGAVGAVILEPSGKAPLLDLTASRRLALAAARSGVMTIVVRSGVDPVPSAAQTRWRASVAPSQAMAGNAPGPSTFDISLLRHRGGVAGFNARVEWDRDRRTFRDAPLSGGIPAVVVSRTSGADARRAA